ncbi:MAG TPA: hypothetical protein VE974_06095 [Thermoanaerobaculia bacterium]|nr:hypothetical protein [Thermoanaerobaculia bacterium]
MATVLTNTGKAQMIAASNTLLATPYVGWGTGAGTAAATDTTLFTEVSAERAASTQSIVTTTVANDTLRNICTLTSVSGATITNGGLFSASSSGNLWVKGDFTGVVLAAGDKIQFTIDIKQT